MTWMTQRILAVRLLGHDRTSGMAWPRRTIGLDRMMGEITERRDAIATDVRASQATP
jgi:hypothetical protein